MKKLNVFSLQQTFFSFTFFKANLNGFVLKLLIFPKKECARVEIKIFMSFNIFLKKGLKCNLFLLEQ